MGKNTTDNLTLSEVAHRFRVVRSTIYRWLKNKPHFPRGFKIGIRHLFPLADIEAYEDMLKGN